MISQVAGLEPIASLYDAFLIDQFGVLHDGRALYPGVIEALRKLKTREKRIVILTNSGKRSDVNRRRILALGLTPDLFDDVLSSGDVARTGIREGKFGPPFTAAGRAFIIGKRGDDYAFGLDLADRPESADFLLFLGSDAPRTSLEDYAHLLKAAAAKAVPALCCNPDRKMLTPLGLAPAPGAIAALYEQLGGPVLWVGKPHGPIYAAALERAGAPPKTRTLCIGDSLEHDICGGQAAGLKTALVRTGVSAALSAKDIRTACDAQPCVPDWILPSFRWNRS